MTDPPKYVSEELIAAAHIVGKGIAADPELPPAIVQIRTLAIYAAAAEQQGDMTAAEGFAASIVDGIRLFAEQLWRQEDVQSIGTPDMVRGWVIRYLREFPELASLPETPIEFIRYPSLPRNAFAESGGDVLIRPDAIPKAQRERAWSLAKYQQAQRTGTKPGGRPQGSRTRLSYAEQRAATKLTGDMSRRVIYELLVTEGVFDDDGPYQAPDKARRNSRRVVSFLRRLSEAAD